MILSNFPTKTITPESIGAIPNPSGGTTGQVLTKTSTGEEWSDAPSGLPEGGTEGQVIKKTADGAEWDEADWLPLSGGTLSGNLTIESGSLWLRGEDCGIWGSSNSSELNFVVNGTEVLKVNGGSVSLPTGLTISGVRTPTSDSEAANKQYVDTQLSTKLTTPTGTAGQLLGFTADNTVGAVDAPETGLTQEQADERYLQLSGGTIEVDATVSAALTLKNTHSTGAVSDVNRSPYLNFETGNGKVVKENVEYDAGYATVSFYDVENDDFVMISGLLDPVYNADAANKAYVDSKASTSVAITLTTSGWSSNTQTVTVSGVSASETAQLITPTPAIASQTAYYEAGIMCTGQAANSLTFTCQTVPTSNLTVYVVIQPLS